MLKFYVESTSILSCVRYSILNAFIMPCIFNFPRCGQIEDVLEQRLVDDAPSDEDDDEELQPGVYMFLCLYVYVYVYVHVICLYKTCMR